MLILALLLIFGFQLVAGIGLIVSPHRSGDLDTIGYVLVASLLIGIGRAWELVGDWDTGLVSSIGLLVGHRFQPQVVADQELPNASEAQMKQESTSDPEQ